MEITREHDFNAKDTFCEILDCVKDERDVVWFSPPCTGESGWQRLNKKKGPVTDIGEDSKGKG